MADRRAGGQRNRKRTRRPSRPARAPRHQSGKDRSAEQFGGAARHGGRGRQRPAQRGVCRGRRNLAAGRARRRVRRRRVAASCRGIRRAVAPQPVGCDHRRHARARPYHTGRSDAGDVVGHRPHHDDGTAGFDLPADRSRSGLRRRNRGRMSYRRISQARDRRRGRSDPRRRSTLCRSRSARISAGRDLPGAGLRSGQCAPRRPRRDDFACPAAARAYGRPGSGPGPCVGAQFPRRVATRRHPARRSVRRRLRRRDPRHGIRG